MRHLSFLLLFWASPAFAAERPNVVLFIADDHGQDAGCYGNAVVKTPAIDQLAKEGIRFKNAFCTAASCSPSRSTILSGLHNHTNGQYGLQHAVHHFQAFSSVQSLPVLLAKNGYRTARIGKFHVEPEEVFKFETILPAAQGNRNPVQMAENCREYLGDKSKPFFLYFCTADPHRGGLLPDKKEKPDGFGNGIVHPGVTEVTYDPKDVIIPPWMTDTPAARAEIAEYYQSVSRVDQGVARLVQVLKDKGQYDNTVFIYASDNGFAMPGSKTTLYEPGIKLPLIVRDPAQTKRGIVSEAMISWVDFTPTILDYAGAIEVKAPPLVAGNPESRPKKQKLDTVKYEFHGKSFRDTLDGSPHPERNLVFASHTFHEVTMYYPMRAIRTDKYKLILNIAHPLTYPTAADLFQSATWQSLLAQGDDATMGHRKVKDFLHRPQYELYALDTDPWETQNLADSLSHKAVRDDLAKQLREFQEKTKDPWVHKYKYE